jgi:hypothetical protein
LSAFLLIGTIVLGLGAGGLTMLVFRLFGRRAPRWLLPTVAGVVMLGFHILMEQTWFDRIAAQLSGRIEVVETIERRVWWQPWTFVSPQTVRFMAVDTASVEEVGPNVVQVDLWLVDRFQGSNQVSQVYDCDEPRRVDLIGESGFDADSADWRPVAPDDPIRRTACRAADIAPDPAGG